MVREVGAVPLSRCRGGRYRPSGRISPCLLHERRREWRRHGSSEQGSYVDGVLWRIFERDEQHLDHYEGFPYLYGKEPVTVTENGQQREIMAYTMNSPYRDTPALPSKAYQESSMAAGRMGSKLPLFWKQSGSPRRNCRKKQSPIKSNAARKMAKNDNLSTGPRGIESFSFNSAGAFFILPKRRTS